MGDPHVITTVQPPSLQTGLPLFLHKQPPLSKEPISSTESAYSTLASHKKTQIKPTPISFILAGLSIILVFNLRPPPTTFAHLFTTTYNPLTRHQRSPTTAPPTYGLKRPYARAGLWFFLFSNYFFKSMLFYMVFFLYFFIFKLIILLSLTFLKDNFFMYLNFKKFF